MQQHRGRLILARSDEVYLFNRVPTFCKLVSVRGIRSIVLHLFDATTQIPLELYATVQNFMRVPNFYEKHLAPIENSKHQHFPLLPSKLNGHSPSHRRAYRYNEKDNYPFKFARWTSSSFHVLCTYVSKFISHSTNLKIFRTTRVTLYIHQISTNVRILCQVLPCNKIYRANRSGSVSR